MKQILQEISELALLLKDIDFTPEQEQSTWLGNSPATDEEISDAQTRLQITFPPDYIEFLKTTNGFHPSSGSCPTFLPVYQIDFYRNIEPDDVELWNSQDEIADVGRALAKSILIGGLKEEQSFLLIPPGDGETQWRYWFFAHWIPGEEPYDDLTHYFTQELDILKENAAKSGLTEPKRFIDYSLRDYVFEQDWEKVFTTAADFFLQNKVYHYFANASELLNLLFLSAGKLNRYEELAELIHTAHTTNEQYKIISHVFIPLEEAAKNKTGYGQSASFTIRENAVTLEQTEEQIRLKYPHLLQDVFDKVTYQLYLLFEGGNAPAFIQLYESYQQKLFPQHHLNAAIGYATLNEPAKAKQALITYFEQAFTKRPLAPFLHRVLLEVMDKEFSNDVLLKFKQ